MYSVAYKFSICLIEQNFKRAESITLNNCTYLNKNVLHTFKMITDSRCVTGCPVLSPNVPCRPERLTGERLKAGDGRKMVERWCDSRSSRRRSVRHKSKRERGTCSCCIVHCRHVMAQKLEESALRNSEGLLEKCLCWNVRKALRLEIFWLWGQS